MAIKGLQGSYIRAIKGFKNPKGGSNPGGNYMATGASCHIVSSRLEPPLLGTPLFLKQTKKISPSFWQPSKLVYVKQFKMKLLKVVHFILY